MFEVKAVKKITVTEQIMEQIAGLITSGQITPGEQLPNERDLAEKFQVTRGRVREALRALSLVGLITIKAGEGSFVNEQRVPLPVETITWMFHSEIHNLDEVYAARQLIETEVYLSAASLATIENHAYLQNILDSLRQAMNSIDPASFLDGLDNFDLYMGDISGNRIYAKLMQTVVYLRRETSLRLLHVPGAIESSLDMRTLLLKSIQAKDMKLVKESIKAHFRNSKRFYDTIISKS
ncbi:FadR/GntR family transcriptional regulator [Cohnella sp. WQ 127256]|uniref:FadR/GntR family transcriptional regulator n=1 Tax=Cohnella sp. WQ 127256 TaxID=2938790 RepID=UPI0021182523|nr:GntR family transcriptional regulator [Cohnella sp. WQ 127256]